MTEIVRRMAWDRRQPAATDALLTREWLVTNGLGGSASGTVAGVVTRRFHGLLIAALPAPLGRILMLSRLDEALRLPDGTLLPFGGVEYANGDLFVPGADHLAEFRLELGLPVWRYDLDGYQIEKRVLLPHLQNTVHVSYRLLDGPGPVRLELHPSLRFRPHEARVDEPMSEPYLVSAVGGRYEIAGPPELPPLRLTVHGAPGPLTLHGGLTYDVRYRLEDERGYDAHGPLWSPGLFTIDLTPLSGAERGEQVTGGLGSGLDRAGSWKPAPTSDPGVGAGFQQPVQASPNPNLPLLLPPLHAGVAGWGGEVTLIASAEPWETICALSPAEALHGETERRRWLLQTAPAAARTGTAAELVLAADQFVIRPASREPDIARAHAAGDEVRTVVAGYHWFTDWGRDTMISLEGLTLATGRHAEAGAILRTFARHVRDGLIPNLFPEGENEGLYHTADATLWFFHALDRYFEATDDRATLALLLPALREIIRHHLQGTRFGIGVAPEDGLLRQGAEGYQLTWMDAKVDDWVVTPRRGKAVEINALWYNALRLLAGWLRDAGDGPGSRDLDERAAVACESFNRRFWYPEGGYLYDVIDGEQGDDPACRPNQLFTISLPHPILDRARWEPVLRVVQDRLLTPVGLRSLAPGHPDYKARYFGDLRTRDAAYHQGTAWGWLAGPFVDAWLRVYPDDREGARRALAGFEEHLGEACLGTISEIFDAEAPYTPRGCVAQAWSVAEVLRSLLRIAAG